jgi:SAM-dependent methyltransferase
VLDGWTNIDVQASSRAKRAPEILSDLKSIPLADACATEAMAIHVFEHFYRWEVDQVLREWKRLLVPEGELVLELPNLIKCCQNLIDGTAGRDNPEQMSYWGIYGDPGHADPYMCHRWGWTPLTLAALLNSHGFIKVREEPTQWHSLGKLKRDMRLVSIRS